MTATVHTREDVIKATKSVILALATEVLGEAKKFVKSWCKVCKSDWDQSWQSCQRCSSGDRTQEFPFVKAKEARK